MSQSTPRVRRKPGDLGKSLRRGLPDAGLDDTARIGLMDRRKGCAADLPPVYLHGPGPLRLALLSALSGRSALLGTGCSTGCGEGRSAAAGGHGRYAWQRTATARAALFGY